MGPTFVDMWLRLPNRRSLGSSNRILVVTLEVQVDKEGVLVINLNTFPLKIILIHHY